MLGYITSLISFQNFNFFFLSSTDIASTNQYYTKQESGSTCQFPSTNSHTNNNEESEFINQALEAIENNIEANNQQSSNPSSRNSTVEQTPINTQTAPSNHTGTDQRRLSQQGGNYSWSNNAQSTNGNVLPGNDTQQTSGGTSQNHQLSSRSNVVPPPGPGPGSTDCDSNRPQLSEQILFNSPTSFPGQSSNSPQKDSNNQQQLQTFSTENFSGQGQTVYGSNSNLVSNQIQEVASEEQKQGGNGTNQKTSPSQQQQTFIESTESRLSSQDSPTSSSKTTEMYYQQYPNPSAPTNQNHTNQQFSSGVSGGIVATSSDNKNFLSPTSGSNNGSQQQYNGPVFHNMQPPFDNQTFPNKLQNPQQKEQLTENGTVNHGNYQIGHQQQQPAQYAAMNHPETSAHSYTTNPGMNSYHRPPTPQQRLPLAGHPNGQSLQQNTQWSNFQHPGSHNMRASGSENISSPPDRVFMQSSQPPKQHSPYPAGTRRPSSHMSGQNNLSPMMQTSPAGSNVSVRSPFRGSLAAGLQSPSMISPSPSGHPSSPSIGHQAHITHSSSVPNFTSPNVNTGYQGQHLQQQLPSRQSWSSSNDLNQQTLPPVYHGHATGHIVGDFSSSKPNVMNQHPTLPHATNHFLVQPGSSHNSSLPRVCASNSVPYNGEQRVKSEKFTSAVSPLAAARSTSTDVEHQHNNRTTASFDQKQHFQETMNSVLYGSSSDSHHSASSNLVSSLSSDSSSDGNRKAMSPIDAQATISPGESGYDSAELSSVLSENSTYSNSQAKMQDGLSITKQESKNLYAASAGLINQQPSGAEPSFLSSALAAANGK